MDVPNVVPADGRTTEDANPPVATAPECPRCGYDLSGQVKMWVDQCPLQGICTECGLQLRWAQVLSARLVVLKWFFEHASGFRQIITWAAVTWWWAIRVLPFWRRVEVDTKLRPWRAVLWPIVLLLMVQCVTGIVVGIARPVGWARTAGTSIGYSVAKSSDVRVPLGQAFDGFVAAVSFQTVSSESNAWVASGTTNVATPTGPVVVPNYTQVPKIPRFRWHGVGNEFGVLRFGLIATAPALTLLVLPHARRTAKLRAAHVVRAFAFSLAPALVSAAVIDVAMVEAELHSPGYWGGGAGLLMRQLENAADYWLFVLIVLLGWLGWWWWCAMKSYQWPRGERLKVGIAMIAVTVAMAATVVLPYVEYWRLSRIRW